MPDLIDADLLRAYIRDSISTFEEMSGHLDPATDGNARVIGALKALKQVDHEVIAGKFTPRKKIPGTSASAKVRRNDPETSFEAAISQTTSKTWSLYLDIRKTLDAFGPQTDDDLLVLLGRFKRPVTPSGVRTRRAELVAAGWVQDTKERRPSASGAPATVWGLVPDATQS